MHFVDLNPMPVEGLNSMFVVHVNRMHLVDFIPNLVVNSNPMHVVMLF